MDAAIIGGRRFPEGVDKSPRFGRLIWYARGNLNLAVWHDAVLLVRPPYKGTPASHIGLIGHAEVPAPPFG